MSWWTHLRDAVEGVAAEVGNFFLPGSGLITGQLVSKGAQEMLNSPLGQLGMLGGGVWGGMAGNLSNYGSSLQALGLDTSGIGGMLPSGVSESLGLGGYSPSANMSANAFAPVQQSPLLGATGPNYTGTGSEMFGYGGQGGTGFMAPTTGVGDIAQAAYNPNQKTNPFAWGSSSNLLQMGSGLFGMAQSSQQQKMAQQAQEQQQAYRAPASAALQAQMGNLLQMPTAQNITQQPGYQSGLEAVQRSMASQGYQGSGNMMAALQQYGQNAYQQAMQNYQQQQNALMGMAGAGSSPALPQAMAGQAMSGYGQSLGALGQGALLAQLGGGSY